MDAKSILNLVFARYAALLNGVPAVKVLSCYVERERGRESFIPVALKGRVKVGSETVSVRMDQVQIRNMMACAIR